MEEERTDQTTESQEAPDTSQESGQTTEQTVGPETQDTQQKLFAGKYVSEVEFEKGYKELESAYGKKSQEAKDYQQKYEQMMANYEQLRQAQEKKEEEYLTDEEKLAKRIEAQERKLGELDARDTARQYETMFEKFLDGNKDLRGGGNQAMLEANMMKIRQQDRYMPPDQLLEKAAEKTRATIAELREGIKKEYSETRTEVRTSSTPKGSAPKGEPESEAESPTDYIAWRQEQAERTRRLY